MDWKKIRSLLPAMVIGSVVVLVSYSLGKYGIVKAQAQRSIAVRPFLAERWLISYIEHPEGKVERKEVIGQRADGTILNKTIAVYHGPGETPTRKLTLTDGRVISISDEAKIRTTDRMSDIELARLKSRLSASAARTTCTEEFQQKTGEVEVAGRRTEAWEYQTLSNDGRHVLRMTFFRSPELGCAELKRVLEERSPGDKAYHKKWETVAQAVTDGDPPASDADPGDDYTEVPPSQFERKTQKAAALIYEAVENGYCKQRKCEGEALMESTVKAMKAADEKYRARNGR